VGQSFELQLTLKPIAAFIDYKETLISKRWQAWSTLGCSILALSATWPLLKWSDDSQKASDDWMKTYQQTSNPDLAQQAKKHSDMMRDRSEWTQIAGITALGIGVVSLGWSIYSFLTYPDKPLPKTSPVTFIPGTRYLVVSGSF
jgi:hypothetical protein